MIEIKRILDRFDSLMSEKNFEEAERLLNYWVDECEATRDVRNRFTLLNELVGFYRMRSEKIHGVYVSSQLLDAVKDMELEDNVSGATAFINVATAYKSFGMTDDALSLYEKAAVIYERDLERTDDRLPALYNNMALAFMDMAAITKEKNADSYSFYSEKAETYFDEALDILRSIKGSENEQAITFLNLADLAVLTLGAEESEETVQTYAGKAYELLEKSHNDGNAEFKMTAEKCIPVFSHYGYFMYANSLKNL